MDNLYQYPVSSNPTVDFLETLASNECSANVDLMLPTKQALWFLRGITLVGKENLDFELWLFSRATNLTGVITTENFLGAWQFNALNAVAPASPGYPVTPHGGVVDPLFHWYVDGNMMAIRDLDSIAPSGTPTLANAELHCRLINRNAVAKSAGVAGQIQATFWMAAQRGW